jgi:hypothetical protein
MAQEVERVVPDAVIQFNRRGNRAVNYGRVIEALAA